MNHSSAVDMQQREKNATPNLERDILHEKSVASLGKDCIQVVRQELQYLSCKQSSYDGSLLGSIRINQSL